VAEVTYQPRFETGPMLERLCQVLGARRAVLWDIDAAEDVAYPRLASGGPAPLPVVLTGDPIRWAWEEALSLRLETPPRWASGGARACVVPLEAGGGAAAVLTLEYDGEVPFPSAHVLEEGAAQLRAFLAMQQETARAALTRERFGAVADLLRRLPREQEPARFARDLASAAARLVGASGGAVALWEEDVGRILALVGEDGGPHLDAVFGPMECEMAIAASTAATLWRERGRGEGARLPIGAPGERWHAEPRSVALLPLPDPVTGVVGVLALWSAAPASIDREGVEVLEMVAPYAAMQLQQTRLYAPLREYAERDALTGLHNRRIFEERLEKEEAHFHRYHRPVALLVLDVDHFKRINDTHGHEAGDAVLRTLGALLQGTVRAADLAARLGGEEFVVLHPETPLAGALEIAERLRRQVEGHTFEWQGTTIPVRISVGVSACSECTPLPSTLLRSADAALYASKHGGRNRVTAAPFATVDPR
jgi:diguanylate cyclase (GGDEF)-like protein